MEGAPLEARFLDGTSGEEIRDADYSRLKALLSQLKANVDANSIVLVQLKRTAQKKKSAAPPDRTPFDFAYAQVRACEVALRASIDEASTATPEHAVSLQAKVADSYEAYARAVTVAQSIAKNFVAENSVPAR